MSGNGSSWVYKNLTARPCACVTDPSTASRPMVLASFVVKRELRKNPHSFCSTASRPLSFTTAN
jgi:hypothetical protein